MASSEHVGPQHEHDFISATPNQATQPPRTLAARSNYPPATHTLPVRPANYPNCGGRPGPNGHRKKCGKEKPPGPPKTSSPAFKIPHQTTSSLPVKTVWVDAPVWTPVKRSIEQDGNVEGSSESFMQQDADDLPAEIKTFTHQEIPVVQEEQQALAQPEAPKVDKNGNLYPHIVQDILTEKMQALNLTGLTIEQRIHLAIADVDAAIAHRTQVEKIFYAVAFGGLFGILLWAVFWTFVLTIGKWWAQKQEAEELKDLEKKKRNRKDEELEEAKAEVQGTTRDVEKGVVEEYSNVLRADETRRVRLHRTVY